jgi:hypothetical protein
VLAKENKHLTPLISDFTIKHGIMQALSPHSNFVRQAAVSDAMIQFIL